MKQIRYMAMVGSGMNVGAAALVIDKSETPDPPRGFYALFGDEEWTEDYDTVMAMLTGESPDAHCYPIEATPTEDLPAVPEEWTAESGS